MIILMINVILKMLTPLLIITILLILTQYIIYRITKISIYNILEKKLLKGE